MNYHRNLSSKDYTTSIFNTKKTRYGNNDHGRGETRPERVSGYEYGHPNKCKGTQETIGNRFHDFDTRSSWCKREHQQREGVDIY